MTKMGPVIEELSVVSEIGHESILVTAGSAITRQPYNFFGAQSMVRKTLLKKHATVTKVIHP